MPDDKKPDVRKLYPEFFQNPVIQKLSALPIWTVSDKDKCPINMAAYLKHGKLWLKQKTETLGYNPLVTLPEITEAIPNTTNFTLYLDAMDPDRSYVVLDVEPSCSDALKQRFLHLPFVYGEYSWSGKGYHLMFPAPTDLLQKYPDAAMRASMFPENRTYEILLEHPVMLTRKMVYPVDPVDSMDEFRNLFETLAAVAKPPNSIKSSGQELDLEKDVEAIPYYQVMIMTLKGWPYKKKPEDFTKGGKPDHSSYEYGMAASCFHTLARLLQDWKFKEHVFTQEEITLIIYKYLTLTVAPRPKHKESRNGMPWLCYIADTVVARKLEDMEKEKAAEAAKKKDKKGETRPEKG